MAVNKDAVIYGIFEAMLKDIPKSKRDKHIDKFNWLKDMGLINDIDLSAGDELKQSSDKALSLSVVRKSVCEHDWIQQEDVYNNYYHECSKCHAIR